MNSPTTTDTRPIVCPFTILVDGREKAPYRFTGLRADSTQKKRPIVVEWEWQHLKTGDYTISGMQSIVCIERKSLADLYSTLGQHRDRFEREHQRMAEFKRSMVVIEASWDQILNHPPPQSRLNPKTILRTSESWYMRYGVPWFAMEDRRLAEIHTFRSLEKAWKEFGNAEKVKEDKQQSFA